MAEQQQQDDNRKTIAISHNNSPRKKREANRAMFAQLAVGKRAMLSMRYRRVTADGDRLTFHFDMTTGARVLGLCLGSRDSQRVPDADSLVLVGGTVLAADTRDFVLTLRLESMDQLL